VRSPRGLALGWATNWLDDDGRQGERHGQGDRAGGDAAAAAAVAGAERLAPLFGQIQHHGQISFVELR
jgi:hypothetical protein